MFYLLLIVPHTVALCGLAFYAYKSQVRPVSDDPSSGPGWDDGDAAPPRMPRPGPSAGGLPLPGATPPHRRLRVGERLAELYPRRRRRDHAPQPSPRTPA